MAINIAVYIYVEYLINSLREKYTVTVYFPAHSVNVKYWKNISRKEEFILMSISIHFKTEQTRTNYMKTIKNMPSIVISSPALSFLAQHISYQTIFAILWFGNTFLMFSKNFWKIDNWLMNLPIVFQITFFLRTNKSTGEWFHKFFYLLWFAEKSLLRM